jgi:uncharacterized protein involved in exopolysaccharide biosynthesis
VTPRPGESAVDTSAERYTPLAIPSSRTRASASPPSPGGSELATYWAACRNHARLLLALPLGLALVALAASLLRPRPYAAHAAFIASEPASMSGSLGALSSVASQLGVPGLSAVASSSATGSAQFYGDLLTSATLLHAVVTTRYDATDVGEFGGRPFRGTLVEYLDPHANTQTDRELAAMKGVARSMVTVAVDRPTGIIRFEVRTKNRRLSELIARRLLDLVNDFNLKRRQTQAGAEREFDARRAQAALDSLRGAEDALAEFRASNIDFSRSPRLGAREAGLQRRVTLAQQTYTTIAQRYELANMEAVRNTPVITVLDAPEGLVESRPRHTAAIAIGVYAASMALAFGIALALERRKSGHVLAGL